MQNHNFHTHSTYSDGKNTPREMLEEALGRGFCALGFSDHSWTRVEEYYCMSPEGERRYRAELHSLSEEFKGRIRIYTGVEQDSESFVPDFDYDYVIASVHEMARRGVSMPIDSSRDLQLELVRTLFGGSFIDFARAYFEKVTDNVMRNKTDIVGHFDLVTKYSLAPENDEKYIDAALESVRECVKYCDTFELNTGAVARGLRDVPYPAGFILDEIASLGGRIIVTSDCHYREKLTCMFDEADGILRSHGFRKNEKGSLNEKISGISLWESAK